MCPLSLINNKKEHIISAGCSACLNVLQLQLIDEPIAAALSSTTVENGSVVILAWVLAHIISQFIVQILRYLIQLFLCVLSIENGCWYLLLDVVLIYCFAGTDRYPNG